MANNVQINPFTASKCLCPLHELHGIMQTTSCCTPGPCSAACHKSQSTIHPTADSLLHSRLFCKTFCKAHGSWSEGRVSFLCDEWSVQIVGQMNRSNELFMHWQIFSFLCSWWLIGCAEKNHLLMIITCKERFYESNHGIISTLLITSSCWVSQPNDEWEAQKRPSPR